MPAETDQDCSGSSRIRSGTSRARSRCSRINQVRKLPDRVRPRLWAYFCSGSPLRLCLPSVFFLCADTLLCVLTQTSLLHFELDCVDHGENFKLLDGTMLNFLLAGHDIRALSPGCPTPAARDIIWVGLPMLGGRDFPPPGGGGVTRWWEILPRGQEIQPATRSVERRIRRHFCSSGFWSKRLMS